MVKIKNINTFREKKNLQKTRIKLTSIFSTGTLVSRRRQNNIFKVLKGT